MSKKDGGGEGWLIVILVVVVLPFAIWLTPPFKNTFSPDYESSTDRTDRLQVARRYHDKALDIADEFHSYGGEIIPFHNKMVDESLRRGLPLWVNDGQLRRSYVIVLRNNQAPEHWWEYVEETQAVYTPNSTEYSDIWTGALLSHAIYHARKHEIRGRDRATTEAQEEELIAHRLEHDTLNGYTKGEYFKLIDEFIEASDKPSDVPPSLYAGMAEPLFLRTQELFPASRSEHEKDMRKKVLFTAINFRLAAKRGMSDDVLFDKLKRELTKR